MDGRLAPQPKDMISGDPSHHVVRERRGAPFVFRQAQHDIAHGEPRKMCEVREYAKLHF